MHDVNTRYLQHLLDTARWAGEDIATNSETLMRKWPNTKVYMQYIKSDMAELSKIIKELEDIMESEGN
jgi:hypothetical protein